MAEIFNIEDYTDPADYIIQPRPREKRKEDLLALYKVGYRYVVRNEDCDWIACFTLKPKRYKEPGYPTYWGYVNPDDPAAKMSYVLRNEDMTEINVKNKSPLLISEYLGL